jgi:hypothetical protein
MARIMMALSIMWLLLLLGGCRAAEPPAPEPALPEVDSQPTLHPTETVATREPAEPAVVDFSDVETEVEPAAEPDEEEDAMEAPAPGVRDPGARLVQRARQALADRLGLDLEEVSVESVEEVTWPDSALGCPAPGMMYLQVLTPGYRIVLAAEGEEYAYHTDRGNQLVLCGPKGQPLD